MKKLIDILNKKNSTRNMTDEEFEQSLPILTAELELYDYRMT